ncbi:MAG: hypothetical protein ABIV06_03965 [Thermoanaerobaculia bacterium]
MKIRIPIVLALMCLPASSVLAANSFSTNGNPAPAPFGQKVLPENVVSISQSTSTTITAANSVSCNGGTPGFFHTDNFYYRAFTLSAFNPPLTDLQFMVQQVTIGVETANDGGGVGQPISVRIYDSSANPPLNATLGAALSTQNITVVDQAATLLAVPLTTQPVLINAADILAVEIFTPNGQTASHQFFIGSNALGQTGPGFIKSAPCGITEITSLAGIGFPNMHIVMSVSGNNQTPVELTTFSVD